MIVGHRTKVRQRANRLAIKLGQVTGSDHVFIVIKARPWYHWLFRGLAWEREWAKILA